MAQHMISRPEVEWVDKNKKASNDGSDHFGAKTLDGLELFVCNAAGTTTTMVGAAASLTASTNCPRLKERFQIYTSAGALKENTVFSVTAHNGTTTVTFTPAAAAATASGDFAKLVSNNPFTDNDSLDARLLDAGGMYTQAVVDRMTQNDKVYAVRLLDDPNTVK